MTRVVVIGGGISGLSAAWELTKNADFEVRVFEASDRFGGKLQTTEFAGKPVDTGADAFLARVPEGARLCEELGVTAQLVSPVQHSSMLWSRGALHAFPKTTILGVPADLDDPALSEIISPDGIARARQEIDLRESVGRDERDISLGQLIGARFGAEIKERLVDPLVGGINAGNVDRLGVASATPQILDLSERDASLTVAAQNVLAARADGPAEAMFYAPADGMQTIVDALVEQLPGHGVELHAQTRVDALAWRDNQWVITTEHDVVTADAVVVATPSYQAAVLLKDTDPLTAQLLESIRYASVAMVRLAYNANDVGVSLDASGFVIPAVEHTLLTACSWSSSKWSELASPDTVIVRASAGRFDDERAANMSDAELIEAAHSELAEMMKITGSPIEADVTRWDAAFPQYEPGHTTRVAIIQAASKNLKTLAFAGAAYEGLGVPACIRSASTAAAQIKTAFELDIR